MTATTKSTKAMTATACLLLAAGLAGCGSDKDNAASMNAASLVPAAPPSSIIPEVPPTSEAPPAGAEPAPAPGSGQTANVTKPATNADTSHLTAVRVARQGAQDRVTFEFSGEVPGYDVGYAQMPPRQDGSGTEVPVQGGAGLAVRFQGASTVELTGGVNKTYKGPERFSPPGTAHVVEAVQVSSVEQTILWAVGVRNNVPFKVSSLSGPSRVVIDIG